ncbi:MAG: efflux RND transporter permease subunit, partial [Bacteroidota bacterium]
VRMAYDNQPDIYDFGKVYLPSVTGAQVPLRQLTQLEFEASPAKIDHFDLQRSTLVTSDVLDGYNSTEMTLNLIDQLAEIDLPAGYDFYIAGEFETQQESFGDLGQLLIIAILGIFAVLILQFKSFRQPFVVLSAIPLAFSGSVLALFTTGFSFSFFAFIGFTSLVGIVVNNSIILVDYTNQLRDSGMKVREALVKAAETRFTPIILTTMTTICGLLPLTLTNSGLWSPMGWTIIGGMISSTLLTLLIVPILYKWLTPETQATTSI